MESTKTDEYHYYYNIWITIKTTFEKTEFIESAQSNRLN